MNLIDIRTSMYIKPVAAMQRVFAMCDLKKLYNFSIPKPTLPSSRT
ncbi:hypothetical protein PRUB_a2192 [Pseudoalteromonas rubra]|uniref:Uncharacterized protein n=1 Tax=Pseudoalteromonas rubra TaxID=43658 RepID=A0A8T0CCG6_9GAMM|nr:hypothetical protein PRUB_a2192 [Pseudoalteromonas rubra]